MNQTLLTFAFTVITATAFAHHGRDFILVEDYSTPGPGSVFLLGNFEWEKGSEGTDYGASPSLIVGVLPQLSLSIEAGFRSELDADWRAASITPTVHIQLTPTDSKSPVRFGLSAGYQYARSTESGHAENADGAGHGAEEEGHHGGGSSIHDHEDSTFITRFITEADLGDFKAVLNLINVAPDHGKSAWGYAVGIRRPMTDVLSVGVEALGDLKSGGWQEVVAAAYFEPSHTLTLKLGLGCGLTEAAPDFSLRTGFVYRF
jgi:hypothetical protein